MTKILWPNRNKHIFSDQFPCSNLGRVFELTPVVKVVIFWRGADETLGPDMNLINSAATGNCLSHHERLEIASLAVGDNYNVAECELWGQLEVVMWELRKQ